MAAAGVLGHDAPRAIDQAGGVQEIGAAGAELGEPGIEILAAAMDQGIVLVRRQQALAPPGRAQHQKDPGCRRRAASFGRHRRRGKCGSPGRHIGEGIADHLGDLARAQAFGQQAAGELRQAPIGRRESLGIRRRGDIVAERQCCGRPLLQQGARAQDAQQPPAGGLRHGQMAKAVPLHAGERDMEKSLGRHGDHGPAHQIADRPRQCRGPLAGDCRQHVALGQNAARYAALGSLPVEDDQRADARLAHEPGGRLQAGIGREGDDGSRHHLRDPVTIGKGIDALDGRAVHMVRPSFRTASPTSPAPAAGAGSYAGARRRPAPAPMS